MVAIVVLNSGRNIFIIQLIISASPLAGTLGPTTSQDPSISWDVAKS